MHLPRAEDVVKNCVRQNLDARPAKGPLRLRSLERGGSGAWEVAARISSLDLDDDGTDGGELDDLTFGVNWYLNPNTRLMLDYILADLDPAAGAPDGRTKILAFRWQIAL